MKTYKKLGLFLAVLIPAFLGVLFVNVHKSLAAAFLSKADLDKATYIAVQDSSSSFHIDMSVGGGTYQFRDSNLFSPPLNFKAYNVTAPFCDGTLYGQGSGTLKGITIPGDFSAAQQSANTNSAVALDVSIDYLDASGKCQNYTNHVTTSQVSGGASVNKGDACTSGADCVGLVCQKDNGDCVNEGQKTNDNTDACAANSGGFPLTWLLCPVLDAANALSITLTNLFEGQLSFKVSDLTRNTGAKGVNAAWAIIRDISSAVLVIIMLIMVISQAVGGGPFDAYTVRKMLPRLVVAVILMQVSWAGLSWMVDRVDDIGNGLKSLMYLPFQPGNLDDFWSLLTNAGVGTSGAAAFSWVSLVAIGIGVAVALPTILMFCFIAIISVLTGLTVLIFRKILIIMALIFAPLAILAWLLPGTQSYWKLWKDNFLKALFMFPIAIAIVASGRIFAYVVGTQGNGEFLNFFLVLIGFFGPLFILPKTFKWGGSLMQSVGNSAFKVMSKVNEKPKEYFKNRQTDWTDQRRRGSYQRIANQQGFNPRRFWQYPLDRFRAGYWDPLKQAPGYQDVGERSVQAYIKKGEDLEHEAESAAEAKLVRERQKHRANGGQHDMYLQAIASGLDKYYDPSLGRDVEVGHRDHLEQMAARRQLAKLGAGMNWRYLEDYYESTRKELDDARTSGDPSRIAKAEAGARDMRKFFDDNVDTILPKLPHIYKSVAQAADADPNGIAQMHGVEIEAILANLTGQIKKDPSDISAQQSLTTFLQNFQRAVENSTKGGPQLENGALRAVKGYLDRNKDVADDLLGTINNDKYHGRAGVGRDVAMKGERPRSLPLLERSEVLEGKLDAEHAAVLESLRTSLAGQINEAGYVQAAPQQTPGQNGNHEDGTDGTRNKKPQGPSGFDPGGVSTPTPDNARVNLIPGNFRIEGDAVYLHPGEGGERPDTDSSSAEALRQAAEAMQDASQQIRRSAVAQAQTARRLGNIINQPGGEGQVISPEKQTKQENKDEDQNQNGEDT